MNASASSPDRYNAFRKTGYAIWQAAEDMATAGDPINSDSAMRVGRTMVRCAGTQDRDIKENDRPVELNPEDWGKIRHLTDDAEDTLRDKMQPLLERYAHESEKYLAFKEAGADRETLEEFKQGMREAQKEVDSIRSIIDMMPIEGSELRQLLDERIGVPQESLDELAVQKNAEAEINAAIASRASREDLTL